MAFLRRRRGLLDAVVFSGGEPTLHEGLVEAMRQVKAMGYRVGLHTAGPFPRRLAEVLPFLDWVGMDRKAPFDGYDAVTRTPGSGSLATDSLRLLLESGLPYEIRTTVGHRFLTEEAVIRIAEELAALGVRHYALQACHPAGTPMGGCESTPLTPLADRMQREYSGRFESLSCR
jgi:pyruvate formate lyase activating enzyme